MRVLVGCERSGVVRDAFLARGHDAMSCDLEESRAGGPHYKGDVREVLNYPWDIAIFHPPCTHTSISGARYFEDKRMDGRQQTAISFLLQLWRSPIPAKCIEQPISVVSTVFRSPDQIVQPYEFGHDASKSTCLWLAGLPLLRPTRYVEPRWVCCGLPVDVDTVGHRGCANCNGDKRALPRWGNQTGSGQNKLSPSDERAELRAATYQGIADAMADQWGSALQLSGA